MIRVPWFSGHTCSRLQKEQTGRCHLVAEALAIWCSWKCPHKVRSRVQCNPCHRGPSARHQRRLSVDQGWVLCWPVFWVRLWRSPSMNTTSLTLSQLSLTWLTANCDLAHSHLEFELICREMDQPLTRPPCFSLTGVVLLSAMNGVGLLGVGWTQHGRYDKPVSWSEAGIAVMLLKRSQDWGQWMQSHELQ